MQGRPTARDIARMLAERIDALAPELLPGGRRDGHEWRCGSVAGEAGGSMAVRLNGARAGVWGDFAAGAKGDALDLVAAVVGTDMPGALRWSRQWLGLDAGAPDPIPVRAPPPKAVAQPDIDPGAWRRAWDPARPIATTPASTYLAGRGVRFHDPAGEVLQFYDRCARTNPEAPGEIERLPALLALLRDVATGEPTGVQRTFLRADGGDRLRDKGARRITGRRDGSVVMLTPFEDVTLGIGLCEGVETGLAILATGWAPVWAVTSSGNLARLPVLPGIECATIFADADEAGHKAATACAERWRAAGRDVVIAAPPVAGSDWNDTLDDQGIFRI